MGVQSAGPPGLVIIGSGPAGLSAAESFRERNRDDPVLMLTANPALPYQRPPLSKDFLRGAAEAGDAELHPAEWFADNAVEVVRSQPVDAIDVTQHLVMSRGSSYPYRWLVVTTGALPSPIPVPGGDNALQLRSLADATALREAASGADAAVVIGAGFIGCEAAASLAMRGVATTLVAPDPVPQAKRLGREAGERITALLTEVGVDYLAGVEVTEIGSRGVHLDNGTSIGCDLVLAATGVAPQADVAAQAGISTRDGRIAVDAGMQTSADNVWAAGDVALAQNSLAGRRIAVEHWQDAIDQGVVAGAAAAGEPGEWDGVPGFLDNDRGSNAEVPRLGRRVRNLHPRRTRRGFHGVVRVGRRGRRRTHPQRRRRLRPGRRTHSSAGSGPALVATPGTRVRCATDAPVAVSNTSITTSESRYRPR